MTTWSVEEQRDGSIVLVWGRKRQQFQDENEALRFVHRNRSPQDRVVRVHPDGYTTPVIRRRWRRGL